MGLGAEKATGTEKAEHTNFNLSLCSSLCEKSCVVEKLPPHERVFVVSTRSLAILDNGPLQQVERALSAAMGFPDHDASELVKALVRDLDQPTSLRDVGIEHETWKRSPSAYSTTVQ